MVGGSPAMPDPGRPPARPVCDTLGELGGPGGEMATTADVVVVGGGVIGASTAFQLASLGVRRVVVCERRFPAAGASGKSGALVRMHYTNEPEARLAHASLPYFHRWGELVGSGDCGFLRCGMG